MAKSTRDKILDYLKENSPARSGEVRAGIGGAATHVSTTLGKLVKSGEIKRVSVGVYAYDTVSGEIDAAVPRPATAKKVAAASRARKTVKQRQEAALHFSLEHRLSDTEMLVRSADTRDYFVLRAVNI